MTTMPPAYRRRVSRQNVTRREAEKLLRQLLKLRPALFGELTDNRVVRCPCCRLAPHISQEVH